MEKLLFVVLILAYFVFSFVVILSIGWIHRPGPGKKKRRKKR